MIKYSLKCDKNHTFEAWFPSSGDYDSQKERGLLSCPYCESKNIEKAPMSPSIAKTTPKASDNIPVVSGNIIPPEMRKIYDDMRETIEKNFDYVGDSFASEARDIHDGIAPERMIYGETTPKEARELIEEGINIAPIPPLANPKKDKEIN
jgi:hypothetical protein